MTDQPKIYSRFGIVKLKDGYAIRGSRLCSVKTRARWWFFRYFDTIDLAHTRLPEFSTTWDWLELTNEGKVMGYAGYYSGQYAKKHLSLKAAQNALRDFMITQISSPMEDWSKRYLQTDEEVSGREEARPKQEKKPFIKFEINP